MGVSTDGKLVYGYIWSDEHELFEGEDTDVWIDRIAIERGATNPWTDPEIESLEARYRDRSLAYAQYKTESDAWVAANRERIDQWYEARRAVENEFAAEVDYHGSDEWTVPIVGIKSASKRAARGYPVALTADDLKVGEDWDAQLARFIETTGIDTTDAEGPGWFLCSYWG